MVTVKLEPTVTPEITAKPGITDGADEAEPGVGLPLVGELRLNLSALGVDGSAPDFGERLCQLSSDNHPYDFQYSAQGELIVMPPTGFESNIGETEINIQLGIWRYSNGGMSSSQTSLFRLPSGAAFMPDAAWITQERFDNLTDLEMRGGVNGAPDFVVEVRSRSDRLPPLLTKMQEWMDGGARLGWLLDYRTRRVHIYRPGQAVEVLENPETLSGEDVLPGFTFEVRRLIFDRLNPAASE